MSYKALYRTYRPRNFASVVGQEQVVTTLQNIISADRIGHAYLFAGPRGTGKTSVAHVFAHEINHITSDSTTPNLDIIEIDAASNNGVAEVRALIDGVRYAPTTSKYKVYIIDEAHMLTKGAFNALLKTLEEPPAHVVFILATTEPHKLPVTVLSRCQRFNFRRITDDVIAQQITKVLTAEGIEHDEEAVSLIAHLAQGAMRDALSITEQVAAFGRGKVTWKLVSQVFGIASIANQITLLNLAYASQTKELMVLITDLLDDGIDLERMAFWLIAILRDYIVYSRTNDMSLLETTDTNNLAQLKINDDFAYQAIDVFSKVLANLRNSDFPRQIFELALLELSKPQTDHQHNDALETLDIPLREMETPSHIAKAEHKVVAPVPSPQITREVVSSAPIATNAPLLNRNVHHSLSSTSEVEVVEKSDGVHHPNSFQEKALNEQDDFSSIVDVMPHKIEMTGEFVLSNEKPDEVNDLIRSENEDNTQTSQLTEDILTTDSVAIAGDGPSHNNRNLSNFVTPPPLVSIAPLAPTSTSSKLFESENDPITKPPVEPVAIEDILKEFTKDLAVDDSDFPQRSLLRAHSEEEVINLFMLADKSAIAQVKTCWNNFLPAANERRFINYASELSQTKLISAARDFILVASEDTLIVEALFDARERNDFREYIVKVFGQPKHVFAITREAFEHAKITFGALRDRNALPPTRPLPPIDLNSNKVKSAEQSYGENLFGTIFKK